MTEANEPVSTTVEIFGRNYVLVSEGYSQRLQDLAALVDGKMREIEQLTTTVDSLKIAVLAALNLADELNQLKRQLSTATSEWSQREQRLLDLMDRALEDEETDESPA